MKKIGWQLKFAVVLLFLSFAFYVLDYAIFHRLEDLTFYFISNVAFLFIDVLIVMLILHSLLIYREKQAMLNKLNMVVGTFFSEVGVELIQTCIRVDASLPVLAAKLKITADWKEKDFLEAQKHLDKTDFKADASRLDLRELKSYLIGRRSFMLGLLENPNLLEHESFTDMLWAVFHLTDELAHRKDVSALNPPDIKHISGDMNRAYRLLAIHWVGYMKHLKQDYPYLFSLAVRTNPFDPDASIEVKQ